VVEIQEVLRRDINRKNANTITQFELLPSRKPERHTPWPTYPMTLKTSSSHEEGCQRMSHRNKLYW
jgi:NADPH-dependent glutamate synthase beta subunit-like oxidoreductase